MNTAQKRPYGFHFRLENTYYDLARTAYDAQTNALQFFLMHNGAKHHHDVAALDRDAFRALARTTHILMFAHSSFRINLASEQAKERATSLFVLQKELRIIEELGVPYLVLHPGCIRTTSHDKKVQQIDRKRALAQLAELLLHVLTYAPHTTIILENTAHGGACLGSDLEDFAFLRACITHPQIKYCIDTAHAFAYGYDVRDTENFITLLDTTMGIEHIALIHGNDSLGACASLIDHHVFPGDGLIGSAALFALFNHPKLSHIPIIIETPPTALHDARTMMNRLHELITRY